MALFRAHGVDESRIDLVPLIKGTRGHLGLYGQVDVALDPFPYAGTTTTCEALWMGVPTITLEGRNHAQNVGKTLNEAVGLGSGFVGRDEAHYLQLAAHWSDPRHWRELARLRAGLRQQVEASVLCQRQPFVANLEKVYRKWWRKYCSDQMARANGHAKDRSHFSDEDEDGGGEEGASNSGQSASAEAEGHSSDNSSQF